MARRLLLRKHLYVAWEKTIRGAYQQQRINSERGLQVFFCAALLNAFEDEGKPRRIFVEPGLQETNGRGGPKPDIMICDGRMIIGIVELKYVPKGKARVAKDLRTLKWIAARSNRDLCIRNNRFLGITRDDTEYSLAADAVLCWAGVHRGFDGSLQPQVDKALRSRFLELHAVTAADSEPKIESNYKPRK